MSGERGSPVVPRALSAEHALLLARLKAEPRIQLAAELQQERGNIYVQQVMERIRAEKGAEALTWLRKDKEALTEKEHHIDETVQNLVTQENKGQPLEPQTRAAAEASFGRDFRDVRIHVDRGAHRLAQGMGARAFTLGRHIFFQEGAYNPQTRSGVQLLGHELTHVAEHRGQARISFWNDAYHQRATGEVLQEREMARKTGVTGRLLELLKKASAKMDYPWRRPQRLRTLPRFLWGMLPFTRTRGEGPDHGEAGDYKMTIERARPGNEKRQEKYVQAAISAYRRSAEFGGGIPDEAMERLGDALHVAQDRGSHWEGAQGMGHDDPRPRDEYYCDDPAKNREGWANALNNTRTVLERWAQAKSSIDAQARSVIRARERDGAGRLLLTAGIWNGNTIIRVQGGQGMHFQIRNLNFLGTTISITGDNQVHRSIIPPLMTVDFMFSCFGPEPMPWAFDIRTESDVFLVGWKLYSTWVPGMMPNR